MSIKSKIAAIAAASLGMVLTQSSAPRAETEDNSAPEKVAKITAPVDVDEDVLDSAVPDEALERTAASSFVTELKNCCPNTQSNKKSPLGGSPKGSTGPTVPPKPAQGNKHK